MKEKKSKSKYSDEDLRKAVSDSYSIRQVLIKLELSPQGGGSYYTIKNRIKKCGIDISHFLGKGHLKGKSNSWTKKIPLEEICIENSNYTNRTSLKTRIIKSNLIENKCSICKLDNFWNEKPLVLVLDHINGKHNDNRLENLRLLCPNCNSQQSTFAGRNRKRKNILK